MNQTAKSLVEQTLAQLLTTEAGQSYSALDLDQGLFCSQSKAGSAEKAEAVDILAQTFIAAASTDEDQHSDGEKNSEEQIKKSHIAGIFLLDLCRFRKSVQNENTSSQIGVGIQQYDEQQIEVETILQGFYPKENLPDLTRQLLSKGSFSKYAPRNVHAKIVASLLTVQLNLDTKAIEDGEKSIEDLFSDLIEVFQEESEEYNNTVDFYLRTTKYFFELAEEHKRTKQINALVPVLLPLLFQVFTQEGIELRGGREQILQVFYLMIRSVSWADGIDNELVSTCLDESYDMWMALLMTIIQSNPRRFFNVKRQALKCLIVIFRDLVNYSKQSLNLILKPAWKLLNAHLPVFTEVIVYNQSIPEFVGEQEEENEEEGQEPETGYESEEEEEIYGIEGMTFYLIELLNTLVQRPNVQPLVSQGLLPLIKTLAVYLLLPFNKERVHTKDNLFFIQDKSHDMLINDTIRSQCLVTISSMVEVFGDDAVRVLIFVIQYMFSKQEQQVAKQEQTEEVKGEADTETSLQASVEAEFKALLEETTYVSDHPKSPLKRREAGLLLLSMFIEDISMFMVRNVEQFDLIPMFCPDILNQDYQQYRTKCPSLISKLVGRQLATTAAICDSIPKWKPEGKEFLKSVIALAVKALNEEKYRSILLVAIRNIVKISHKLPKQELAEHAQAFETILDPLLTLVDNSSIECLYLPIEAFTTLSKINEETVAQMTPKVLPRLLKIFSMYHSESSVGHDLVHLFKLWCNYNQCRQIFIDTFIPFIMDIVQQYYKNTPNVDNKTAVLSPSNLQALEKGEEPTQSQAVISVVDASILQQVLDLLCSLLKNTKTEDDFQKIVSVFPQLIEYVEKSEDMFLLLNGTTALKTFIHYASDHCLKVVKSEKIIAVCKKLLSPQTNEQAALCLGNLVIQVIHKVQPKIDTSLLMCVVWKIYKSRMPSIVQSLVLIFARLIQTHPKEIVEFLSETSIDNRICLKIVLDKWLLQQALFRGTYTKTVTLSALMKLFKARDPRIETLMVVGYNPSHSNINSDVNAPFKMLSLFMRYLENESKPMNMRSAIAPPVDMDSDGEEEQKRPLGSLAGGGYSMMRSKQEELGIDSGDRMDTMGGGDEYDENGEFIGGYGDINEDDRLEVNMDDMQSDDCDSEELIDLEKKDETPEKTQKNETEEQKMNQTPERDPQGTANKSIGGNSSGDSTGSSDLKSPGNMFAVGESKDKGLADMETGSEVYMSELLAGFDMDDFDEADEMNEDDLIQLGDEFAKIDLQDHIEDELNDFVSKVDQGKNYVFYCAKQLLKEDKELVKRFVTFPKDTPPLQ